MQTICHLPITAEQYVQTDYQRRVRPPANCPNCGTAHRMKALSYYWRYLSRCSDPSALIIWGRRFLCRGCKVSVSCLPDFAQPYRFVSTATIEAGFNGQDDHPDVQRWRDLIARYWRRFQAHLPRLILLVGPAYGAVATPTTVAEFWKQLRRACGGLATTTRQLVEQFRTCLFGTYRCHQPKAYQAA